MACSTHDAFIWRQSGINRKISLGEIPTIKGWFLGDSGYPLRPNLLTPILSPGTPGEGRYSRSFLKTRKKIECAFGLWKSRWRSMDKTGGALCCSPDRVCWLILTTMVLHNICIDHSLQWQIDVPEMTDDLEPEFTSPDSITPSGDLRRQEIIVDYFDLVHWKLHFT